MPIFGSIVCASVCIKKPASIEIAITLRKILVFIFPLLALIALMSMASGDVAGIDADVIEIPSGAGTKADIRAHVETKPYRISAVRISRQIDDRRPPRTLS
jgi:hypothetical protein